MNYKGYVAHKGDLVSTPGGSLWIVVGENTCADSECRGQLQLRLIHARPGSDPTCWQRQHVQVIAPAANLVAE